MKQYLIVIAVAMFPMAAFGEDQQTLSISSTCQVRSLPGGRDGSTVEYIWKIKASAEKECLLSVEQLTRSQRPLPLPTLPDLRGYRRLLYCEAGSTHEKEIRLEVDQALEGGQRAYWFEGFMISLINEDIPLSESATVSVTTRQINDEDESGHLLGITVSDKGREISRHYLFISFVSLAELQNAPIWAELNDQERDLRDGDVIQFFTEAKSWEPAIRRFTDLDK
jgi:hypothetical protein